MSRTRVARRERDRGSVLVLVLVLMVIASLMVLPIMSYATSVFRAQNVEIDKTAAVQLARGGTWVALSNEGDLYRLCDPTPDDPYGGGPIGVAVPLPSSLEGVSTTCTIMQRTTLHQPDEIPFALAVVQGQTDTGAKATIPPALTAGADASEMWKFYDNPTNSPADPAAWLAATDWSHAASTGSVWLPKLPVQATSVGDRQTDMADGTWDAGYSSCKVFFPGTFNSQIVLDGPTYFASGVYYFTEPIVLRPGADVVVGDGADIGCTSDHEAVASVITLPDPINMSGRGGTFILGGNAKIDIDDAGATAAQRIRFVVNQRYVASTEVSVAASSGVSIASVNGDHLFPGQIGATPNAPLNVANVIAVPQSIVDAEGDPTAVTKDYTPSVLTPKPGPPTAPAASSVTTIRQKYRFNNSNNPTTGAYQNCGSNSNRCTAAVTVSWDPFVENGAPITGYQVTRSSGGSQGCAPPVVDYNGDSIPDEPLQTSCTVTGLGTGNGTYSFTITATSDAGNATVESSEVSFTTSNLGNNNSNSTHGYKFSDPVVSGVEVGQDYANGIEVRWAPVAAGNTVSTILGYEVRATRGVDTVSCQARPDEVSASNGAKLSCVLPRGTNPGQLPEGGATWTVTVRTTQDFAGTNAPAVYNIPTGSQLSGTFSGGIVRYGVITTLDTNPSMSGVQPLTVLAPPVQPSFAPDVTPAPGAAVRVPAPIIDLRASSPATIDINISGYVAVPQGHVHIDPGSTPSNKHFSLLGGIVAGEIHLDGAAPAKLSAVFDNPIAQKLIALRSTGTDRGYTASSDAVVQVNKSRSVAINSWIVG